MYTDAMMPSNTLAPKTRAWDTTKRRRSERVREIVNSLEEEEEEEEEENEEEEEDEEVVFVFMIDGEREGACACDEE